MQLYYLGYEEDGQAFECAVKVFAPDVSVCTIELPSHARTQLGVHQPSLVVIDEQSMDMKLTEVVKILPEAVVYAVVDATEAASVSSSAHGIVHFPFKEDNVRKTFRPIFKALRLQDQDIALRRAAELSSNGMALLSPRGRFLYANATFCSILGIPRERVVGHTLLSLFSRVEYGTQLAKILRCLHGGNMLWAGLLTGERQDTGKKFTVDTVVRNCRGDQHAGVGFFVQCRDITEEVRVQQLQRRFSQVVMQTSDSVVITDLDGVILYVNPAFEHITGYSMAEVLGQTPRILKSGEHDDQFYQAMWRHLISGQPWCGVLVNRRKNGEHYWEDTLITPILDEDGVITCYSATKRDITKQRMLQAEVSRLESDLAHAQKIESIGQLAGGIAHDFNNMLQGLLGYSELIELDTQNLPEQHDNITQVLKIIASAQKLTRQLLAFSRKQAVSMECFDITHYLTGMKDMFPRLLGVKVKIKMKLKPDLPPVLIDAGQIDQVLLNLMVNARDAMPPDALPEIVLSTNVLTLDQQQLNERQMTGEPGLYVALAVTDNGAGIPEDKQKRIFDPFYTTKAKGQGTGLGLSVVYGIMKQANGHVEVESKLGHGSTFTLLFPVFHTGSRAEVVDAAMESTREEENVVASFDALPDNRRTILVVEDDPIVARVTEQSIRSAGLDTIAAATEAEGFEMYKKWKDSICMLFSDIVLTSGNGVHLADAVRAEDPTLPVLLTSGFASGYLQGRSLQRSNYVLLVKPYNRVVLLHHIRQVLFSRKTDRVIVRPIDA